MTRRHLKQPSLKDYYYDTTEPYPSDGKRIKSVIRKLILFVAQALQPLFVVENRGFRGLMSTLDRRVKLPSCKTISSIHLPALYKEVKAQLLIEDLETIKCFFLNHRSLDFKDSNVIHDFHGAIGVLFQDMHVSICQTNPPITLLTPV